MPRNARQRSTGLQHCAAMPRGVRPPPQIGRQCPAAFDRPSALPGNVRGALEALWHCPATFAELRMPRNRSTRIPEKLPTGPLALTGNRSRPVDPSDRIAGQSSRGGPEPDLDCRSIDQGRSTLSGLPGHDHGRSGSGLPCPPMSGTSPVLLLLAAAQNRGGLARFHPVLISGVVASLEVATSKPAMTATPSAKPPTRRVPFTWCSGSFAGP